eukprot:GHRR01008793.1.p1 GENE.GHRR01008793.1~~GHRR01008793.1.p1  ORF type:complete len:196 (+),score=76.06 GHRR01008793.1:302-889(+)
MGDYTDNGNGERVLAGSRRPDGTLRKERRIRAGYTPQDEQPTYQSNGVQARQGIPKCPGLDPEQATAAAVAKSKSAKKNEKRKAKKAEGATSEAQQQSSNPVAKAPQPPAATPQPAPASPSAAAAASDAGAALLDKQLKTLSKKVRQCQGLVNRQAAGEALSQQEQEKVAKMSAWQEDIRQLEHQLAKLGTSLQC